MVCGPTDSVASAQVATPVDVLNDTVQSAGLPLSVKVTVPERPTASADGVTVAVKVTDSFTVEGVPEVASAVALATGETVSVTAPELPL
jgi:hypothetical protein